MRNDPWNLPYGVYIAANSPVLFDRRYRPIVRLEGQWPKCDSATAIPCDPAERIKFSDQEWFYHDGTSPRFDLQTRRRLKTLVESIPALGAEIERRGRVKAVRP